MNKFWNEIGEPVLKRWLLTPFSNTVTKIMLYTGAAIVAAPLLEHLLVKVVLQKFFDIDIPIDVPDTQAYVAGVCLMLAGSFHNIVQIYFDRACKVEAALEKNEAKLSQVPHDKTIIDEILSLLPYENTHYWLEQASYAGLRRDFCHDLDSCEKFITPPYKIYNESVEENKKQLILKIKEFNSQCMEHLGAQEDRSGKMYLPPFHWKSQGKESEAKYYEQVKAVAKSGQEVKEKLDLFIECVKYEGFIVNQI